MGYPWNLVSAQGAPNASMMGLHQTVEKVLR